MFNCNILVVDPKFVCIFVHLAAKFCNIMSYTWIFWSVLPRNINQVKFYMKTRLTLKQSISTGRHHAGLWWRVSCWRCWCMWGLWSRLGWLPVRILWCRIQNKFRVTVPHILKTFPLTWCFLIYLEGKVLHDFHCYRYKISTTIILQLTTSIYFTTLCNFFFVIYIMFLTNMF